MRKARGSSPLQVEYDLVGLMGADIGGAELPALPLVADIFHARGGFAKEGGLVTGTKVAAYKVGKAGGSMLVNHRFLRGGVETGCVPERVAANGSGQNALRRNVVAQRFQHLN